MNKQSTLDTLLQLAQDEVDEAASQLQAARQALRNAEQQLSALLDYRQDYAERLQKSTQAGLSASNYHNFRQFIATLDKAITQQNRVTGQLAVQIEQQRDLWQQKKRRLSSFEALQTRQRQQYAQAERRLEQRLNDELSTRQSQQPHHNRPF